VFYSLIFALTTPLAAKFASYYGVKHSVLISVPFYLGFVGLLYALPYLDTPLVIISSLMGLSQAFYWMGMHLVFHHASDHDHRGEEVGKRVSAALLARFTHVHMDIVGPLSLINNFSYIALGFIG